MTRLLPTLLLALLVPAALAQTGIVADPNPFVGARDSTLVLRNAGAEPVALDSLRFTTYGEGYLAWIIAYTARIGEEDREGWLYCNPYSTSGNCEDRSAAGVIGVPLAPTDSVVFRRLDRECPPCRSATGSGWPWVQDTLLVYAGGVPDPLRVPFEVFLVASETAPEASSPRLDVYPNPARDRITAHVDVAAASELEAVVYDAMGRLVGASRRGAYGPGTAVVPVDVGGLPPGPYVVEVRGRLATGAPVRRAGTFVVVE